MVKVLQNSTPANSGYIMSKIAEGLLVRPMACIKESI